MNDIVKSVSLENLTNQRNAVLALFEQGAGTLREAAVLAKTASVGFPDIEVSFGGRRNHSLSTNRSKDADVAELLAQVGKAIDAGGWAYLMHESGLRTFMDAQARKEWDAKIHDMDVPALTMDNINATFTSLHDSRRDMFERGVVAVFRALSWCYKRNEPFKFGKRIIMNGLFYSYGNQRKRWLSTNNRQTDCLDDLQRVFRVLDGKPEPDHRQGWNGLLGAAQIKHLDALDSEYFSVKWFLNGNGHIRFNRPELVERMNLILAKHHPNALACEVR